MSWRLPEGLIERGGKRHGVWSSQDVFDDALVCGTCERTPGRVRIVDGKVISDALGWRKSESDPCPACHGTGYAGVKRWCYLNISNQEICARDHTDPERWSCHLVLVVPLEQD